MDGKACQRCGSTEELQWHHRDRRDKVRTIGSVKSTWPWRRLMAEIEKCDLLCRACHRNAHAVAGNWAQPWRRLTDGQVRTIVRSRGRVRQVDLAARFGVTQSEISMIVNRHIYRDVVVSAAVGPRTEPGDRYDPISMVQ